MDWLEEELRSALARKEPSPAFAARVGSAARRRPHYAVRRWLGAAAAVLVIAGGSGGLAWRHHEGVVAKRQVLLALRISAAKLNRIQTQMREVNQ